MFRPVIDAVGGRSYRQASQTPGAVSGRRDVVQWYSESGVIPPIALVHKVIGGGSEWDISYPTVVGATNWTNSELPANVTHERPRPRCLTRLLWFVQNVGGFPGPMSKSFGRECNRQMARTKDGGATWDSIAVGDETCLTDHSPIPQEINHFARIARAVDGRLWASRDRGAFTSSPIRSEIYWSDDDGDTWTFSFDNIGNPGNSNRPGIEILCHPTNKDVIALVSVDSRLPGDPVIIFHTLTRGASWIENQSLDFGHTGNGQASRHMMLPDGRIVIVNSPSTSAVTDIWTSDDKGLTWTLRYSDSAPDDEMILLTQGQWVSGTHLVALRVPIQGGSSDEFAVVESIDGGDNWTVRTVPAPAGNTGNNWDAVYDPADDRIIAHNGNKTTNPRIWQLKNATNGGITWDDVTGDLTSPGTGPHWLGISLIPFASGEDTVRTIQGMIVKVEGAAWRMIGVDAYTEVTPTSILSIDIEAKVPGGSYESIFSVVPTIDPGDLVSSGGILRTDRRILPIGTLVKAGDSVIAGDISVDLHYRTRAVSQ